MKGRLLDLLVCPTCSGRFALQADVTQARSAAAGPGYDSEVIEGTLTCTSCGRTYPIINAVPRILGPALLRRMEARYPDYFARHRRPSAVSPTTVARDNEATPAGHDVNPPGHDATPVGDDATPVGDDATLRGEGDELGETLESFTRQRLDLRPPGPEFAVQWRAHFAKVAGPELASDRLAGKLALDAGAGFGRHLVAAAELGAEVVGIELSGGVDVACRNTWHLDRVHLVQTNLYQPPFAPGTFDVVWSFGVLHHLPDPRGGFHSIARLARPDDGIVAVWVYGYEGMAFTYRLSHLRAVRRLLARRSPAAKVRVSRAIAAALSVGYWGPLSVLDRAGFHDRVRRLPLSEQVHHGWSARVAAVHDRVATPITHYHDRPELEAWFAEQGMKDVEVVDTNRRGWRAFGRWRAEAGAAELEAVARRADEQLATSRAEGS
jgi:uncharacterized protein YbaR (Trm112 family)/SAM-dependent methyltransferase